MLRVLTILWRALSLKRCACFWSSGASSVIVPLPHLCCVLKLWKPNTWWIMSGHGQKNKLFLPHLQLCTLEQTPAWHNNIVKAWCEYPQRAELRHSEIEIVYPTTLLAILHSHVLRRLFMPILNCRSQSVWKTLCKTLWPKQFNAWLKQLNVLQAISKVASDKQSQSSTNQFWFVTWCYTGFLRSYTNHATHHDVTQNPLKVGISKRMFELKCTTHS